MESGRNPAALQPLVPMPPGDHIVVSDPFIDDFIQSARPQCSYAIPPSAAGHNSYTNSLPLTWIHSSDSNTTVPSSLGLPPAALGRVFPGDQPVIVQTSMSPTHPYIPPVFPCGLCRREILDNVQAVQCYLGCKFWFHRTCVGLSEENFHLLLKDPYAEWMCDPCCETKGDTVDSGQYKIIRSSGWYSSTS